MFYLKFFLGKQLLQFFAWPCLAVKVPGWIEGAAKDSGARCDQDASHYPAQPNASLLKLRKSMPRAFHNGVGFFISPINAQFRLRQLLF